MPRTDVQFAGQIPELYERLLVPMLFAPYAEDLAARAAALAPSRVLETAAGTGAVTRAMALALPAHVDIVATDLNQAMLDRAATTPIGRTDMAAGERVAVAFRRCKLRYRRLSVRRDVLSRQARGFRRSASRAAAGRRAAL